MREPERERWPLCPRVEVLPMPEPMPRPTRLRFSDAPLGARTVDRFMMSLSLLHDLDQMRHFRDHAPDRGRVFALDDLVQTGEAQPAHDLLVLYGRLDVRAYPAQLDLACRFGALLRRHD